MEPRIQYATTGDGVRIAFWTLGEGMGFVHMPWIHFSHIQLEWQSDDWRSVCESLARKRMLVRYDGRGTGLSDREVTDHSLEAHLLDLEAVVDKLGMKQFALFASMFAGPPAIAYAARHPEQVSHLILWVTSARASDWLRSPRVKALDALAGEDWETYTEALAHMAYGWSEGQQSRREAAFFRECVTRQAYQALMAETRKFDVEALLSQVTCPTLVLHRREVPLVGMDEARRLASGISQAYLTVFEGTSPAYYLDDAPVVLASIDEFLREGDSPAKPAAPAEASAVRTILFTDVEGSTALTQRLGDAAARELLREHERTVRECLKTHGGSEVKTMGDGFMASFGSATRALECAVAIQRAFAERASAHPEALEGRAEPQPSAHGSTGSPRAGSGVAASPAGGPIRVRIGLNAGEPIAEEDPDGRGDLFGTAVIAAARIAAQARGGEILLSNVVRELVAGKGFLFSGRGKTALSGFDDPVEVYEVRWEVEAP